MSELSAGDRRSVVATLRANYIDEMRSAELYQRLAQGQPEDSEARKVLETMAGHELHHAQHWKERMVELGGTVPRVRRGPREIVLPLIARFAGLPAVSSLVEGGEARGRLNYLRQSHQLPDQRSREIASEILPEEREHQTAAVRLGSGAPVTPRAHLGNYIRDLIFGLNDGLVTNFALVSGVSGADTNRRFILLAGVAGVLGGSLSMAVGSYLSTKSQREIVEAEIAREAEEIEYAPDEEREELRRIYERQGFSPDEVDILVTRISSDKERWLNTLIKEELGLSTHPSPPPVAEAAFTGGGFVLGSVVPLMPYLVLSGHGALVAAAALSVIALFAVGAAKSLATTRSALRSGFEMLIFGSAAAAITYLAGRLVGGVIT